MSRKSLSKANIAFLSLSIIVLLILALSTTQCKKKQADSNEIVYIIDTIYSDTVQYRKTPVLKGRNFNSKRKNNPEKLVKKQPPTSRKHLDEPASHPKNQ